MFYNSFLKPLYQNIYKIRAATAQLTTPNTAICASGPAAVRAPAALLYVAGPDGVDLGGGLAPLGLLGLSGLLGGAGGGGRASPSGVLAPGVGGVLGAAQGVIPLEASGHGGGLGLGLLAGGGGVAEATSVEHEVLVPLGPEGFLSPPGRAGLSPPLHVSQLPSFQLASKTQPPSMCS